MAKEKEAATLALTFTCLEGCFSVECSSETALDLFKIQSVRLYYAHELIHAVEGNLEVSVNRSLANIVIFLTNPI